MLSVNARRETRQDERVARLLLASLQGRDDHASPSQQKESDVLKSISTCDDGEVSFFSHAVRNAP